MLKVLKWYKDGTSVVQIGRMFTYFSENIEYTVKKEYARSLSQPSKFCKHGVWTSKRKLLGVPKPLVTWLGKSITSKAIRQKGKCDDE